MKGFPWRAGMLTTRGLRIDAVDGRGRPYRVERDADVYESGVSEPDPNDGPTKGAFLEAVRERLVAAGIEGGAKAHLYYYVEERRWAVCYGGCDFGEGDTEFAALMAAWETT